MIRLLLRPNMFHCFQRLDCLSVIKELINGKFEMTTIEPNIVQWMYYDEIAIWCVYDAKIICTLKFVKTSTKLSCSGPILAKKLRVNSVRRAVFYLLMLKMDFYDLHRFSWEKIHKNDRSHAIVISIITNPLSLVP